MALPISKIHVMHYVQTEYKAIADYTLPSRCTPVTPFPAIGDAAIVKVLQDRATDIGNMHKKFGKDHKCGSRNILPAGWMDGHMHTCTVAHTTILHSRSSGQSNNIRYHKITNYLAIYSINQIKYNNISVHKQHSEV